MQCVDHGKSTGCHPFGYGWKRVAGKTELLHRVVYCESHGIPLTAIAGEVVRHTCDNPRCIHPPHLILGTQADNMADVKERGRWRNREVQVPRTRKMSPTQRVEAMALLDTMKQKDVAALYGVCQSTIARLKERLI